MISLSKSGGTVTFTFDDNSTYLQNGTIEVPVNSLSLILDESNMATFRKSASNDIFVSANIAEFGMSKSELEAWYKENMVGGTGGTTPEEVQQMIDESISGKADSVSAVSSAEYVSSSTTINFKNIDGDIISSIDASDFVIDGMVDDVKIETISGVSYLVIDFNTASGKEDIQIPLTDIFDPSNYYTKAEVDNTISAATSGKADSSAVTQAISGAVGTFGNFFENVDMDEGYAFTYLGYGNQEGVGLGAIKIAGEGSGLESDNGLLTVVGKVNESTFNSYSAATNTAISGKQDALVSGTNIKTINNESILGSGNISIQAGGISSVEAVYDDSVEPNGEFDIFINNGSRYSQIFIVGDGLQVTENSGDKILSATGGGISSGEVQTMIDSSISGKADSTDVQTLSGTLTAHTADTTIHVTSSDKSTWSGKQDALVSGTNIKTINNESILGSGNITISGGSGGNPTVELTQAEYDALVTAGTVSANTYYIITDAQPVNLSGKVDTSAITSSVTSASTDSQIPTAKAVFDAIPTGGTGGGMTEDDELLLATALTDLNDRKIDASEVKSKYQRKGDYATKAYVTTALEPYETKLDEINTEEVTAYALNDLNERFGGLKIAKITESEYAALTTKDENTLYIVVADPS